jgi:4a-hydroxytetrahydrobiopterin dehydratase
VTTARTKLDDKAIAEGISRLRGEWRREGDKLVRNLVLPSYRLGLRLVQRIGDLAEGANHHPEIRLEWGTLRVELTTHDAGGITARDLHLAGVIEDVLAEGHG